ncbi:MAG: hypothetical protein IJE84_04495, partial [Clostridia bacterium]|nr:hypothetical protein [Clostridia bacterium]
ENNIKSTSPAESAGESAASVFAQKTQTVREDAPRIMTKRAEAQVLRAERELCEQECRKNAERSKAESEDKGAERAAAAEKAVPVSEQTVPSVDGDGEGAAALHIPPQDKTSTGEELARELAHQLYNERARAAIDAEIEKVRARFPEIKNTLDVVRLERYPEVKRMVARGYALSDAVRLAYEDVYVSSRTQAALREARGSLDTSHIRATSPTTSASHEVSEEQIKVYLSSVPGATREGAIRAYQKYKIGK